MVLKVTGNDASTVALVGPPFTRNVIVGLPVIPIDPEATECEDCPKDIVFAGVVRDPSPAPMIDVSAVVRVTVTGVIMVKPPDIMGRVNPT